MRLVAIVSAAACIIGGVWMLLTQPADSNSIFGPLLHGIGLYCIGKGLWIGPSLINQWRTREATEWLARQQGMGAAAPPAGASKPAEGW